MNEKDIKTEIIEKIKTNIILQDFRFLLGTEFNKFSLVSNYRRLLKYDINNCLKIKGSNQDYEWPISYVLDDRFQFYRCNDILEKEQNFEQFLKYFLLFLQMERIASFYNFKENSIQEIVIDKRGTRETRITEDREDLKQRYLSVEQKKTLIKYLNDSLADYYTITDDFKVIPVDPVVNAVRQIPECEEICRYYDQNDIKKALAELRKITEFSSEKNKEFKNFILSQSKDLQEMCKKVYDFITTYENHLAENAGASDTEARIWFDLGLSIYRLYLRQ